MSAARVPSSATFSRVARISGRNASSGTSVHASTWASERDEVVARDARGRVIARRGRRRRRGTGSCPSPSRGPPPRRRRRPRRTTPARRAAPSTGSGNDCSGWSAPVRAATAASASTPRAPERWITSASGATAPAMAAATASIAWSGVAITTRSASATTAAGSPTAAPNRRGRRPATARRRRARGRRRRPPASPPPRARRRPRHPRGPDR